MAGSSPFSSSHCPCHLFIGNESHGDLHYVAKCGFGLSVVSSASCQRKASDAASSPLRCIAKWLFFRICSSILFYPDPSTVLTRGLTLGTFSTLNVSHIFSLYNIPYRLLCVLSLQFCQQWVFEPI